MRVYVAANAKVSVGRARRLMSEATEAGHEITFDWTMLDLESGYSRREAALAMRSAVTCADALVLLWSDYLLGALIEVGMALGAGKRVVVSGGPMSVFWALPGVTLVPGDEQVLAALNV